MVALILSSCECIIGLLDSLLWSEFGTLVPSLLYFSSPAVALAPYPSRTGEESRGQDHLIPSALSPSKVGTGLYFAKHPWSCKIKHTDFYTGLSKSRTYPWPGQVRVQLPTSADNVTLLAFAAECQSIYPVHQPTIFPAAKPPQRYAPAKWLETDGRVQPIVSQTLHASHTIYTVSQKKTPNSCP